MASNFPFHDVHFNFDYTAATQGGQHLQIYLEDGELTSMGNNILAKSETNLVARCW